MEQLSNSLPSSDATGDGGELGVPNVDGDTIELLTSVSTSTFGTPGSPPSSVVLSSTFNSPPLSPAVPDDYDDIVGLDTTAFEYLCDIQDNYTLYDGNPLSGQDLLII